jgi:hypothetical protein
VKNGELLRGWPESPPTKKGFAIWFVMPGLVPGIHVLAATNKKDVDGRDKARP